MSLFDTLFPRRSRVAEDPHPHRTPRSRSRLRGLGTGERLESRLPLAITGVVRTTPDDFFIDTGRGFDSGYTAYTIESDGLGPAVDVWVRAANFSAGTVGFGPGINNEDGKYRVGTLDGGVTSGTAYLYFTASGPTATPQTYDIEVWNGDPDDGGTQIGGATTTFTIDSVQETIAAEPNKIDAVSFSPATPVVGDLLVLEVDGRLGNGADRVLFAPATRADWQPDVFELRATDISISGATQTPDRLSFDPLPTPAVNQQPFTAVYTFLVARAITTTTAIDPTQFTQDGTQSWKHHKPDDTPFPPIPPVTYDLALSKTNGTSTYVPGGTTTWTITLTNTGKIGVDDVLITDMLPPQVDATTTTWTVDYLNAASGTLGSGGTGDISGTVDLGPLTGGIPGTVTITINANILPSASGAMTNEVTAAPPEGDPLVACDTDLDINLSLTKDDGVTTYTPGGTTTYQIVLANTGLADVTGVAIQDILPPQVDPTSAWQVTYTNASGTLPAMGSGNISGTVDLTGSTGVVTITIFAKIFSSATGPLTNTVTATLRDGPTLTASDTNARLPDERLTLTKDDGVTTYVPGESTTYTITLTNIGLSDVSGLLVNDLLPTQLDRTTTTWRASYANATGTLPTADTTGDILGTVSLQGSGGAVTITIDADILSSATEPMTNTVTVTNGLTLSASDTNTPAPRAELIATKSDGETTVVAGDGFTYTYTLTVTNTGPSDALEVEVVDEWPAGFAQVPGSFTVSDGVVPVPLPNGDFTWSVGTLAAGATATLTVDYTVPSGTLPGVQTNTALVTSPTDQTDTTVTDTTTVDLVADLSILKTDGLDTAIPGTAITYTITVSNEGPSDVLGAVIDDALPAEILGATWTATYTPGSSGPSDGVGSLIGVSIDLVADGTAVFTVTGTIDPSATGVLENTATVTPPEGVEDPNPGDETSTDRTTLVPVANLTATKSDGETTVVAGDGFTYTYTLTVTNTGPSDALEVEVVDEWPAGFAQDAGSFAVSQGAVPVPLPNGDFSWSVGTLAAGATATLTVDYTVPSGTLPGVQTNTAVVSSPTDQTDTTVTDTTTVDLVADLSILKTDGQDTAIPGTAITYTITVSNEGPSDVLGAVVDDTLPAEILGATWTAEYSPGSSGPSDGVGSLAGVTIDLLAGGTAVFTVSGTIDPLATGLLVNEARVTPPENVRDPNPGDETSIDETTLVPTADLAVAKERTSGPPVAGGVVTYEITVSNLGPSSVTSFLGVDVTNPELEAAAYTVSTGTYDDVAGVWTADPGDPFVAGETVVFTLTGTVPATAVGSLVNRVTVGPPDGVIDPDPDNNTAEVDDPLGGRVVLTVTKDDGSRTYKSGGVTTWTIIVTNTGPSFGSGIRVEDPLPPQVASATWTATYAGVGSTGPASGAGSIDVFIDLAVGGTATFTLEALISEEARGDMTNTVTATPSPNTGDPVSATDVNAYDGPINPQADLPGLVLGSDDGCNDEPWVRLVDPETGDLLAQFLAYEMTFRGSVRVATGDVTGDGIAEIIVGPGRNRIGEIRVFTPEGIELEAYRTLPFGRRYRGGVEVAAADVTGDGVADIVAGMSSRIGRVSVFEVNPSAADPVVNTPYRSFRGALGRYRGGVMIAAGDVGSFSNGALVAAAADGRAEIIVGLNAGRRSLVRVFDVSATPRVVQTIRPFTTRFRGGVTLSTAAYQTAGVNDILIGAGPRGDSTVEVYDGSTGGRVARLDAFASFAKPNAAVFAAALDMNEDGVVDDVFGVQGRAGSGGTRGVKQFDRATNATTTLTDAPILAPPLRIAPIVLRVIQG